MIGRFTQEDTYRGDGLNLYAYCAGNPVYYVDPSGHICRKTADRVLQQLSEDEQGRELLKKYQKQIEDALSYQIETEKKKEQYWQTTYADKTIAYDGNNFTMSGYGKAHFNKDAIEEFRTEYTDINGNKKGIMQMLDDVIDGYDRLEKFGYKKKKAGRDDDIPYSFYASHAEKMLFTLDKINVIGVSRNMCTDCQDYFWAKAKADNEPKIIADPSAIHIFMQDGKQINILYGLENIRIEEGVVGPRALKVTPSFKVKSRKGVSQ